MIICKNDTSVVLFLYCNPTSMAANADTLPIFDGFSQEEIAYFLLMSQTQYRKPGEVILTVGEASNGCAYFVKS
jgi:hypothetical protein